MTDLQPVVTLAIGACTLLGILAGWLRWIRPRIQRSRQEVVAVRDAILGRDAVRDSITGREIEPALPGMGVRMATVEEAIKTLADQHAAIDTLGRQQADHERRITTLEASVIERVAAHAESAQAWAAVEAVAKQTPTEHIDRRDT